jgi:hypothetical protein
MFGLAPPGLATRRSEQGVQKCSTCRFESPLRKDTALRPVPNVESRPGVFLQHLLESELIGWVQRLFLVKAGRHQLCNVAILSDGHANYRPLLHGRVVFVTLESGGILPDLQSNKDQRRNHANGGNNLREIGYLSNDIGFTFRRLTIRSRRS